MYCLDIIKLAVNTFTCSTSKVLQIDEEDEQVQLKYMIKSGGIYVWPEKEELSWEEITSLLNHVAAPTMINSRNHLKFSYKESAKSVYYA